jgi:acyl-CoA synthetase (AMP-forming)/AMP-acid ligase II
MDCKTIMLRSVDAWPDRESVVHRDRRLTFAQAWDRGVRMANILREAGMQPGDRIAVLEDNTLESSDFFLACTIGNFVRVPLYVRNSPESHLHMVGHTGCRGMVIASNHAEEGLPIAEQLPSVTFTLIRDESYEGMLASASPEDIATPIHEDDLHLIRHTGGTTAKSKGVAFTHRRWISVARDWLYNWPTIEIGDAFLHQSPISHGSGYFFMPSWMNGGRNVMLEKLVPDLVLDIVEEEKITHMLGIPTILSAIVRHPDIDQRDVSSVKGIMVSGAPVAESTAHLAHKVFGNALYTGFGQTEINPVTFMSAKEWFDPEHPERILSAGRVQPFADMKILDPETHEEVPVGCEGELAARSDGQMAEIWGEPEETELRLHNGWVLTGDVGRLDEFGYLYIMDRKGDMIISGGFNIYPAELENVILSHPAVTEVAVFAVPNEKWGESPMAVCFVADLDSVTEQDIVELCIERLGSYKKPAQVVFRTEPLPKNAAGKLLRRVLREPYWEGRSRRVSGS